MGCTASTHLALLERDVAAGKQLNLSELVSSSVKWKYLLDKDIMRTKETCKVPNVQSV